MNGQDRMGPLETVTLCYKSPAINPNPNPNFLSPESQTNQNSRLTITPKATPCIGDPPFGYSDPQNPRLGF